MARDSKSNLKFVDLGTLTLSGTTPAATNWVDTQGADSCTFVLLTNTVTDAGTAAGFSSVVQESDSTAAASATAATDLIGDLADLTVTDDTADNIIAGTIGYAGEKRYARLQLTGTTGTSAGVRVLAVLSHMAQSPTDAVGASVVPS